MFYIIPVAIAVLVLLIGYLLIKLYIR